MDPFLKLKKWCGRQTSASKSAKACCDPEYIKFLLIMSGRDTKCVECGEILFQPQYSFSPFLSCGFFLIYLVKWSSKMFTQSDFGLKLQQVEDLWLENLSPPGVELIIRLNWSEMRFHSFTSAVAERDFTSLASIMVEALCAFHATQKVKKVHAYFDLIVEKAQQ